MSRWTMPVTLGVLAAGVTLLATSQASGASAAAPTMLPPTGGDPTPRRVVDLSTLPGGVDEWTGSAFVRRATGLSDRDREALIMEFVERGAVPPSLLQLRPVTLRHGTRSITAFVMPDVFAVGTDADRFRPALTAATAQRAMDALGLMLPTEKVVRATYDQAEAKIPMRGFGAPRDSFARHVESNAAIAARIATAGAAPTAFVAGHSKDYVIGGPRRRNPDHVAIYGAWDAQGTRIQMSSGRAHALGYRDYSQRARGMAPWVLADGVRRNVADVILDPQWSAVLHDDNEGRVTDASQLRYPT